MTAEMTPVSKLASDRLAGLIVDALIDAGVIQQVDLERAIGITTEEIDARKAVRDYWCTSCVHASVKRS